MQVRQPLIGRRMHGVAAVVVVAVVTETAVEVLVLAGMRSRASGCLSDRRARCHKSDGGYQAVIPISPARGELRVWHIGNIHEQLRSSCARANNPYVGFSRPRR